MKSISYIACPYTHPDPAVREYRARLSAWVAGNLVAKGEVVYCPITHGHMMARECDLPTDWEFWMANDSTFFALCDKLYVVKADGWEQSCGVQVEIAMAADVNMPVEYIDPDAFGPRDGAIRKDTAQRQRDAMVKRCHEQIAFAKTHATVDQGWMIEREYQGMIDACEEILAAGEAEKEERMSEFGSRKRHELKVLPEFFEALVCGSKNFELRYNDRKFKVGDVVVLKEYIVYQGKYTGRETPREIEYILDSNSGVRGLLADFVILGLKDAADAAILASGEAAKDER